MSENKDNKLTLINEKTANDYLTHTNCSENLIISHDFDILTLVDFMSVAKKKNEWKIREYELL